MSESNKIVLTSSDKEAFEVDEAVARELQIVAQIIDDGCAGQAIPLTNVTADVLGKVIEFCKKHVEAAGSIQESDDEEKKEAAKKELEDWDAEFTKLDLETLFRLLLAANYLNTKSLLDLLCQKIADLIKDKSVEDVREIFNVENDYTAEEEAAVRKENQWAFE